MTKEKRVYDIEVIPGRTLNYADPRGPQYPQAQLIKGRKGTIRSTMLKMFRELDPDGEIIKKEAEPEETQVKDDTEVSGNVDLENQSVKSDNETPEDSEDGEDEEDEEDEPKKKTKFLGKGKKKGK